MEWIIGIYLVIGVIKTLNIMSGSDPSKKPAWMSIERDPIKLAFSFTFFALVWPITKS